jgi:di/tripeptidase
MNVKLLKEILAVQTQTNHEHHMVAWLVNYIVHNIPGATVTVDPHRNVYATKGSGKFMPTAAAHIDTVQPFRKVNVVENGTQLTGFDADTGDQCGLGADDKTGIFVCLELLRRFRNIRIIFFAGEECGTIGARAADYRFFEGIAYVVEWDCPSRNMVSYTCGGEQLFANDGDFIKQAHPVLKKHGSVLWQHHPYTDVMTVRRRFPITCLNLSSGYYRWHANDEFVSIPDVELALEVGFDLFNTVKPESYAIGRIVANTVEPLVQIGSFFVPEAAP